MILYSGAQVLLLGVYGDAVRALPRPAPSSLPVRAHDVRKTT